MKNILSITVSLLFLVIFTQLPAQGDLSVIWDQDDIICKESERADQFMQLSSRRNEFANQTDIHYQLMMWEIDPAVKYISGEITYYFKSLVPDLNALILDMSNALQINSLHRNGQPLTYAHGSDQLLTIHLAKNLGVGSFDTVTIHYEGVPPSNGFGSFEQGVHAGAPIIWTLSEPYGARDWWPNKQDLIDKVDSVDIFITTPLNQLAASNGKLVSITETSGKLIHHWRHRHPIVAYLVALAVTNYSAYSHYVPLDNGDSIEILNYVYPETLTASQIATLSSVDIMTFYNEMFGTYPFADEKYGHAQFGWGGGMEHQTMSFMGGFSFGLQSHEMAHQWFGDKVTCGSWTDIWLNEGFATYLAGLTLERFSPTAFWPQWKSSTSISATSQPGGSVFVDDTTSVGRIFSGRLSYNKGAYLLHMMRWIAGDAAFFQACRDYLNGPGTAFSFGSTDELKTYMENTSGLDFDEFLDDWFYGQGFPAYDLRWTQQTDSLIMWLSQSPSDPSVDFFEMPVPILVKLNGVNNIVVLDHTQQDQRVAYYISDDQIDSIGIDPDKWLLSRNNTITEILTSVGDQVSPDPILVFPNPAKDHVQIVPGVNVVSVDIITMTGHISTHKPIHNKIDLFIYPPGLYTLFLKDANGKVLSVKRILKL